MTKFGATCSTPRQKLALITFAEEVRQAHAHLLAQGAEPEFAKAVATYLALGISTISRRICVTLTRQRLTTSFERHALGAKRCRCTWDYGEVNPFSDAVGSLGSMTIGMRDCPAHLTRIPPVNSSLPTPNVVHGSATALPWPENFSTPC
jgi:putative DNA methylase